MNVYEFSKARPDLQLVIKDLDKRIRKGIVDAKLYEHPEIQKFVNELAGVINHINTELQSNLALMNDEGKRMYEQKQMYQCFVNSFVKTPENLESLSTEVDGILMANNMQ